jgi:hypothetical protein
MRALGMVVSCRPETRRGMGMKMGIDKTRFNINPRKDARTYEFQS